VLKVCAEQNQRLDEEQCETWYAKTKSKGKERDTRGYSEVHYLMWRYRVEGDSTIGELIVQLSY